MRCGCAPPARSRSWPRDARGPDAEVPVKRIHPFVYGHVVAALIVGVAAGATLDAQAPSWAPSADGRRDGELGRLLVEAGLRGAGLAAHPGRHPRQSADAGGAGLHGRRLRLRGRQPAAAGTASVAAIAILVAGVCLLPPFGGWLWRWWKRSGLPSPDSPQPCGSRAHTRTNALASACRIARSQLWMLRSR